ncbi:MAG: hypothetical protein OEV89_08145 [Desulfobulbaceae bacterium]|nr:hypothetical protein [Desulfobulbaceae bacterium]
MKRIVRKYAGRYVLVAAMLATAFFLASYEGAMAVGGIDPEQCSACHQKVSDDAASKRYVHAPVREKRCAVCHIARAGSDRENIIKEGDSRVQWLSGSVSRQQSESWFSIPPVLAGKKIILQAEEFGKKVLLTEVKLPNFVEAEQLVAASRPPEILELTVDEVKQGIFLTARITWKTDRVTDSLVLYGENEPTRKSIVDSQLTKDHEVLLTDLQSRKTYNFVAVSQDIFGNKTVSPVKSFSTNAFFSRPSVEKAKTTEKVTVSGKYFRADNRFFARFTTNRPLSMRVGTLDGQINVSTQESRDRLGQLPPEHLPFTDDRFLNTGVCFRCHPQSKDVLSHPVDVKPKQGMVIDKRYYKLLADGRLTCMSCHMAHASDNEDRISRSDKKKLCLGCHKNFE